MRELCVGDRVRWICANGAQRQLRGETMEGTIIQIVKCGESLRGVCQRRFAPNLSDVSARYDRAVIETKSGEIYVQPIVRLTRAAK